ncbi:hypothetical protein AAHZ94_31130, partial [Streptomyces sp. HSW2009]|uniref:hypothetical protein n=1 Tax=Streptomyces sp. HSW2009 TaxID=3142890 RepID=UPI0032EF850B
MLLAPARTPTPARRRTTALLSGVRWRGRRAVVWAAAGGLAAATLIGVAAARSSSGEAEAGRTTREAGPARAGGQETGAPAGSGGRSERPADAAGDGGAGDGGAGDGGADAAGETAGAAGEGRDGRKHGAGRRADG